MATTMRVGAASSRHASASMLKLADSSACGSSQFAGVKYRPCRQVITMEVTARVVKDKAKYGNTCRQQDLARCGTRSHIKSGGSNSPADLRLLKAPYRESQLPSICTIILRDLVPILL